MTSLEPLRLKADEEDKDEPPELPPFRRYESQGVVRQISFYLSGEIGAPIQYTELLYTLRTASKSDLVLLHLNTPGGNFDTGLQIINNIGASDAHVVTILEARAYSMGAMIFLAGDELVVHDTCQLMFHNYSSALIGKGNEQQAQVMAISRWFEKVMRQVCKPFLTDDEVARILRGEDIWMDSDDIRRRLAHLQKGEPSVKQRKSKTPKTAEEKTPPTPDKA
ncbi:ATP-dependent protease ClpP, protease subunit [Formivibrio citricus]|uniref:ATP-dependent protease ClpP, protease subunit n=1 Tax=Formivibrio citricus TaxID=83765 RepID=A0A1I4WZE8_9NEIS|nr:Clp protease ClpP [Formivibrio citricus]SFN19094.1 ATP-dependent protease ClpP, protease subunit [Formivibrio citricus]